MTFEQLVDGLEALYALERGWLRREIHYREPPGAPPAADVIIINRGVVQIVPIARASGAEDRRRLRGEVERVKIYGVWRFGNGFHAGKALTADEGYGKRLAELGMTWGHLDSLWTVGELAVAAIHSSGGDTSTFALHVVPGDWHGPRHGLPPIRKRDISHQRTVGREIGAADPRWEWPTGG